MKRKLKKNNPREMDRLFGEIEALVLSYEYDV
jgi:hypothetical protein